ncbi:MAG: GldG family protein [Acidobacteria bacterium]|nr:GldG family protein [Acidobacteriota bacterium]
MKKYLQQFVTLGLVLLVAAVIRYLISNVWEKWNLGLVIAGVILVIIGIVANYRQILTSLGKRSTKYLGNYVASVILVIAVVAGLNYIGLKHTKRFDATSSGQYTLAPQTVQLLKKLGSEVNIKAFFPGGDYPPLRELLTEYRTQSSHIRYEFVDPDKQPDIAKQNDVTAYGVFQNPFSGQQLKFGTLIITQGDRREKIEKRSEEVQEEDLTNAIIKVGRSEAKRVYFVQGHGEKDPADTDRTGYSEAKRVLESQGYSVGTVNLASQGKVPEDAKVLILAGATTEPFPQEIQFINDFLNRGGVGLFLMIDPQPAPSFESLLTGWGVQPANNLVLDVSGAGRLMGTGPSVPLVLNYENHKITDRFNAMTFFPFTRSIDRANEVPAGITVETLFKSNENSWGETDLNNREASFDPSQDQKGPLSLAVAATKEIKPSSDQSPALRARLVVAGTSNFPINAYFPAQGNGNLFMNIVSWLAQDEDLISIRPKPADDRRILLTQSQLSTIRLVTIVFLPGIALIAGIIVLWNRRRR